MFTRISKSMQDMLAWEFSTQNTHFKAVKVDKNSYL